MVTFPDAQELEHCFVGRFRVDLGQGRLHEVDCSASIVHNCGTDGRELGSI